LFVRRATGSVRLRRAGEWSRPSGVSVGEPLPGAAEGLDENHSALGKHIGCDFY
jgi:hypothetical protein